MAITPIWQVEKRADSTKLLFDRAADFAAFYGALKPGQYELTLRKHVNRRSTSANAYYWACVVPILAEFIGCDHQEAHEALKRKFLTIDPDAVIPITRSTAELDSTQFAWYVDSVRRFAAEFFGCAIPGPGEVE